MKFVKIIQIILMVITGIGIFSYFTLNSVLDIDSDNNQGQNSVELTEWGAGKLFKVLVDPKDIVTTPEGQSFPSKATFRLKDELKEKYSEIGVYDENKKSVFIIPLFTAAAYQNNGFYDFYKGKCDETCLTVKLVEDDMLNYDSSANAVKILQLLGYNSITDMELNNNPEILKRYDKVIVLHSEYVSKAMFDAITSHDNVIFLYPNALYAEIIVNNSNTITLVRGHGYPDAEIANGFDWENENTHPYEYDIKCSNWNFYPIPNGHMLNCYPEKIVWQNESFLKLLKDL